MTDTDPRITRLDDRSLLVLDDDNALRTRLGRALESRGFDVVLLNAVWHHLDPADRDAALRRVTEILRPGGRAVVALRHGAEGQGVAALDTETEAARAAAAGFETLDRIDTGARAGEPASAGITWTWLILEGART